MTRRGFTVLALATMLAAGAGAVSGPAWGSTLAVRSGGAWHTWWRSEAAPAGWSAADSTLARACAWRTAAPGIEWAELELAGDAPTWRTRLVLVRLDPVRVRFDLVRALDPRTGRPSWTLDRAPADALVAFNAGQFVDALPWGWLVLDGRERLAPGPGPLSAAFAVGADEAVHWLAGDALAPPPGGMRLAFQSYPALLAGDGDVPEALRREGAGVDLRHRDARLALGLARDGRVLVALTRFDVLGERAGAIPLGPTTPEMAAVMGALGARAAMSLDGGISAQLLLREHGRAHRWPGWRKVPLALVVRARSR